MAATQLWQKGADGQWHCPGRPILGGYNPLTFQYGSGYGTYWPGPTTSGLTSAVLQGATLTADSGTSGVKIITTPTVSDLTDYHCEVQPRVAGNVFTRCKFRGNSTRSSNGGLCNIGANAPYGSPVAIFYDCEFDPDLPSVWWDAVMNHDFIMHRCRIAGTTVDGIGVYGASTHAANVEIYGLYVDNLGYFSPDPNHSSDTPISKTHNDCIQWQGGANLTVAYSNLAGYLDPTIGEANYSSASPNPDGGGPNNPAAGPGYNVNYSDLAAKGKFLIDGGNMQISGTNGGECAGLNMHHNLLSGANRAFTISQSYTSLGTVHDNTFTLDQRASVAANIPTGMDGGQGSGKSLEWYNNLDLDGNPVPIFHF